MPYDLGHDRRRGAPLTGSPPKGVRFITRALQKDQPGQKVPAPLPYRVTCPIAALSLGSLGSFADSLFISRQVMSSV